MGPIEGRWRISRIRREALIELGGLLAESILGAREQDPHPLKGHKRIPGIDELLTAFDFEKVCFANLKRADYDYTAGGSDAEFTLRRNREAFGWVKLIVQKLAPSTEVNCSTQILGTEMPYPILIAPTGYQGTLHPEAEAGMYGGAAATGTPMIVANFSTLPIEEIAAAGNGPLWAQIYPNEDLHAVRGTLERFQTAGVHAIVVTVDQQQTTPFERDLHNRNLGGTPRPNVPTRSANGNHLLSTSPQFCRTNPGRRWYTWKYLDELHRLMQVPMLVKGILTAEDARICVERGYDGIIVSNHGGRSLDHGPSPLEVLPEIVDVVGGRIPVLTDSGFRRGFDIVKAIALGADGICLGRTVRWGLGAFGASGVKRVLEIVQAEFREAMRSIGRSSLAAVDSTAIRTSFP